MVVLVSDSVDWRADEKRLIAEARARGDRLLNVAEGGDEPFCPPETRSRNGKLAVAARTSTPEKSRLYRLKKSLGDSIKRGQVSEPTLAKIRAAAVSHPHVFGIWADV